MFRLSVLRKVSRSFYLSIRLLPAGLREPVALAYLLARATDTIADTAPVPAAQRLELLRRTAAAIQGGHDPGLQVAADEFALAQRDDGERRLMSCLAECISDLEALTEADRADVRTVLGHIVRGQTRDIDRPVVADAYALHEYTYLVAGSVGEFWTDMCVRHVPQFATRPHAEMRTLGREFGCALQLVNIVRDAGDDRRVGRSYLPADELAGEPFANVWSRWQQVAADGLADGMTYAQAVNSRRIRAAVALPALIGRDTLSRVRAAGPKALDERIKVPRREVRMLLLRIALGLAGRETLQREWDNRAS
jgi:farnesyl-diphosphate farnesyltransferase